MHRGENFLLYSFPEDRMPGSLMVTTVSPYDSNCRKRPSYYISRNITYPYTQHGGGWISKTFYNEMNANSEVCCTDVSCHYERHEYTPPFNVGSLENIVICNLLYWLQQVGRHDITSCKIRSPLIRILQSLAEIDLPEHFKISQIVSHLKYIAHGRRTIKQHICFPDNVSCMEFLDENTEPFSRMREEINCTQVTNVSVRIRYVCVRFGQMVLFPKHGHSSLPIGIMYPYENSSVDSISFGPELYPPFIRCGNLVRLYEYFKKNKSFKCCVTNFSHVNSFKNSN